MHADGQRVTDARGADLDDAGRDAIADTVADGILDDGLQAHVRNRGVQQLRIHVDVDVQPVREARLFDG